MNVVLAAVVRLRMARGSAVPFYKPNQGTARPVWCSSTIDASTAQGVVMISMQ